VSWRRFDTATQENLGRLDGVTGNSDEGRGDLDNHAGAGCGASPRSVARDRRSDAPCQPPYARRLGRCLRVRSS
jgi:hypothetical protein